MLFQCINLPANRIVLEKDVGCFVTSEKQVKTVVQFQFAVLTYN
jgi:hypothetical protein